MTARGIDYLDALVSAFNHPIRLRIAWELSRRGSLSPVQFTRLYQPRWRIGTVAYHFRALEEAGVVLVLSRSMVRGAVVHHYALTAKGRGLVERLRLSTEAAI